MNGLATGTNHHVLEAFLYLCAEIRSNQQEQMPKDALSGFKCPIFEYCNTSKNLNKYSIEVGKKNPSCWNIAILSACNPEVVGWTYLLGQGELWEARRKHKKNREAVR